MKEAGSDLGELAARHGTDKLAHGYIGRYRHHLEPRRDQALRLLEIGVAKGGSLRMWRDYLPRSSIAGLDIRDLEHLGGPGIRIFRGNQADPEVLRRVVAELGGLDVVIDDGSHVSSDVIAAFQVLFPLLSDGGLYAIEDLHASYWVGFGGEFRDLDTGRTSVSFLKRLVDGLQGHWIPGRSPGYLDCNIDAIHFYPKLAMISKGPNPAVHRPFELKMMAESLAPPPAGRDPGSGTG